MERLARLLLMLALVSEVVTQTQPSLSQYLQLAGLGQYAAPPNQAPNYPHPQPSRVIEVPRTNAAPAPIAPPKPTSPKNPPLDTNVLNNLAIALQLLIVSNILNSSPCELSNLDKFDTKFEFPPAPYPVQAYIESPKQVSSLPNSNFLGASNLEPVFGSALTVRPNPRANMALMSPYEALGPGAPYSDPILSTMYAPSYSKRDFQSPYASILSSDGSRDLFSLAELF